MTIGGTGSVDQGDYAAKVESLKTMVDQFKTAKGEEFNALDSKIQTTINELKDQRTGDYSTSKDFATAVLDYIEIRNRVSTQVSDEVTQQLNDIFRKESENMGKWGQA